MGTVQIQIRQRKSRLPRKHAKIEEVREGKFEDFDQRPIDSQHLLISALLPSSVKEFIRQLENEVTELCGARYAHGKTNQRWGTQNGSIVLGTHHVAIEKPRVRSKDGREVNLKIYDQFQDPKLFEQAVFTEGIKRVSQRDYEKGVSKIANSFGFKKSQVSKRWVNATARKIEELQTRDLSVMDVRAVFVDGKRFRKHGVIIALGIAGDGRKFVLGIYQADTENSSSCLELLNDLEHRGLTSDGLLFIVDGGSGLNKALNEKYRCNEREHRRAIRIRCHVHKWRNIESALGEQSHKALGAFWAIRDAKSMSEARVLSDRLETILRDSNLSALESFREAKDDLLAIHELRLSRNLKRFFSTTNAIESLNSLIEEDMRRVKKWKSSEHFQRWLATYLLASEKRMRRPRGHAGIPALWVHLRALTKDKHEQVIDAEESVA
jgi:putative transposase